MKKRSWLKAFAFAVLCTVMLAAAIPAFAESAAASEVTYSVTYNQAEARSQLKLVNNFRQSSTWCWDETNQKKLPAGNVSALSYDYELEKVAMQRAADLILEFSHTRPNGAICWTAFTENGYSDYGYVGENIAVVPVSYGNPAQSAFNAWREEDKNYAGQGHRRNMLNGNFTCIALGCVEFNGYYYWVQEFSSTPKSTTPTAVTNGSRTVKNSVLIDSGDRVSLAKTTFDTITLAARETKQLPKTVNASLNLASQWPKNGPAVTVSTACNWKATDNGVTVSGTRVTGKTQGTHTLTATVLGQKVSMQVKVSGVKHNFKLVQTVEPTCTEKGYELWKCTDSGCNATEKRNETPAKRPHL